MSESFRWLVVCTGNICRSPMAERLIVTGLRDRLGVAADRFIVTSAGTHGLVDHEMEPLADQVLSELGGDGTGFRARRLDPDLVAEADLVTTATLDHRAIAVSMHPRAASRTFTLRELSRLLTLVDTALLPRGGDPVERARAMVAAAAGKRGHGPSPQAGADDVRDPYGAPLTAYRKCGAAMVEALRAPLDAIAEPARLE